MSIFRTYASSHTAHERSRSPAPIRQAGGERRRLTGARRPPRSADRAVQAEEARAGGRRVCRHGGGRGRGGKSGAPALLDVAAFRNADALLHVVRMFRDPSVPHAAGSVDPARDVRTMEDEVILADLGAVERRLDGLERDLKKAGAAPELKKEQEILQRCRALLEDGQPLRNLA